MATNGKSMHQMSHQVSEVLVKSQMEDDESSSVAAGGIHGDDGSIDNQSSNSPSSDTRTSTSGNTGGNTNENIFNKERGALSGARCCFIMTLIVAAAALATVVSLVTTNEQTQAFAEAVSIFH